MNINELITKAHGIAKSKGFWDTERNTGELLMLIVSECGEALESHRKGKRATREWMEAVLRVSDNVIGGIELPDGRRFVPGSQSQTFNERELFDGHIKDSFEDELADIVIRIADLMGGLGLSPDHAFDCASIEVDKYNVGSCLLGVVSCMTAKHTEDTWIADPMQLTIAVGLVQAIAKHEGIDLERHIELKMAYNETRPHKHGKAY